MLIENIIFKTILYNKNSTICFSYVNFMFKQFLPIKVNVNTVLEVLYRYYCSSEYATVIIIIKNSQKIIN